MAGYAVQIHVEVRNISGRLGEVSLDPGHATAWDLISQMHLTFPLPYGTIWKLAMEDEPVTDKSIPITGESAVTCVKCILTKTEEMNMVSQVEELLCTGRSVDDLPLESHLIWLALQSLTFGDQFDQSMDNVALPSGLQSLTFGPTFNQSMDNVALPSGLQSLTLVLVSILRPEIEAIHKR